MDEKALQAAMQATTTAGQRGDLRSAPVSQVVLEAAITAYLDAMTAPAASPASPSGVREAFQAGLEAAAQYIEDCGEYGFKLVAEGIRDIKPPASLASDATPAPTSGSEAGGEEIADLLQVLSPIGPRCRSVAARILALFAPILAEKERIAQCWEKECEERTSIGKMALDRALAAEAALAAEREGQRLVISPELYAAIEHLPPPTGRAHIEFAGMHCGLRVEGCTDEIRERIAALFRKSAAIRAGE